MSARIDAKNHLVYKVGGDVVSVVPSRGHYGEKRELVFFLLLLCRYDEINKRANYANAS